MSPSQPPTPSVPPVLPSSGNTKYIVVVVLLVVGIAALLAWRSCANQAPVTQTPIPSMYDAAPTPHDESDLVPPPLPPETPQPEAGVKYVYVGDPCNVKSCSGKMTDELETALGFRGKQAHRCYDQALGQDPTLKGHVGIRVRVASNGRVCSANVTSNDMGTPAVAQCVAGTFARTGSVPAPKNGCVDVELPINFVPGGK
jgi:hypothetical protein